MEEKTPKLCRSAPFLVSDRYLEQRLEKTLSDVNSFINLIYKIKGMNIYFRAQNHESKKKFKNIGR